MNVININIKLISKAIFSHAAVKVNNQFDMRFNQTQMFYANNILL